MIKNSVYIPPENSYFPSSSNIFQHFPTNFYLYPQIVGLLKIYRKIFLTNRSDLMRLYLRIVREKLPKINIFWSFLIKEGIKKIF